jgi:Protein-disulfide isomerase
LRLLLLLVALVPGVAIAAVSTEQATAERTLGDPKAPVTFIEYSSMTCPHCAAFHRETLPKIKSTYVDTGKVLYVFRDFPLEPRAVAASMIARCVDPSRYFAFVGLLYGDQAGWAKAADPLKELQTRAELAGLSEADVKACLANKDILESVQKRAAAGEKEFSIDSTPTFIIDGKKFSGAMPYEQFEAAINAALAAKK